MPVNFAVNYLAVIVAAIAAVVIGIVYYGLAGLGDRLARLMGSSPVGRPGPAQLVIGVVERARGPGRDDAPRAAGSARAP